MRKPDPLLQPFRLCNLTLRNRIFSSAHAPSYAEEGHPKNRYRLYHEEKAKGGVALTMIGGSTNIAPDSPSVFGQLYAGDDSIIPWFRHLTDGVKSHGSAVMCQITHMGRRTGWDGADWLPVIGPSPVREQAHRSIPKEMEQSDIDRVVASFAQAARRCVEGGFDGIEILCHSHLLGQFLSPHTNKRNDDYGGSLENRTRMALEVLDAVRAQVGRDIVLGMRVTGDELIPDGLTAAECVEIAQRLSSTGHVDFLNTLAGAPYDDLGLAGWVPPMGYGQPVKLTVAQQIRNAVEIPVFYAGGINDLATARHAISEGMVDMVAMTRAQIADPHMVNKIVGGDEDRIRPCVGLGYCVDRVNQGKDAVCGHNAATGREAVLRHTPAKAENAKTVVVVGGGAAGLEAARVSAHAGHKVHLYEASDKLGGQLLLASKGTVRRQIAGVLEWLVDEVNWLAVDVRLGTFAEREDILQHEPDLVIIATGGWPDQIDCEGGEHALSSWDVLSGNAVTSGEVLIWDEIGAHSGAVITDFLTGVAGKVWLTTQDHTCLQELGVTTRPVVMKSLYAKGVAFKTDVKLKRIEREGNRLRVTLANVLTAQEAAQTVDHVVVENGSRPFDDVYEDLRPLSKNAGLVDQTAMQMGKAAFPSSNNDGGFALARVGDCISSRNLHAAIYDANRLIQGWRE
ncbi:hypothetical protein SAMN05444414_102198 [Roseovarius marisflavi]|uniref:2,4-dienoyl-CoA reductase n=1 Tax=Roseovarius marisflavi TaxID=1054996 RepID=A0A1M6W9Q9_9RHOB|nr:NADH:flavin oxidoreductase [Roseovarius marisflavi]SHK90398.1 hypothetical protein SAMN05444414_102198 [Roseovarius marisflavi]